MLWQLIVFLSFPRGTVNLFVVCDCGISWPYALVFLSYTDLSVLLFGKSTLEKIVCVVAAVCIFVSFPRDGIGLSVVCDCGILWSYSPTFSHTLT